MCRSEKEDSAPHPDVGYGFGVEWNESRGVLVTAMIETEAATEGAK